MTNRQERRKQARETGTKFEPNYNGRVITKAEYEAEVEQLKKEKEEAINKFKASEKTE